MNPFNNTKTGNSKVLMNEGLTVIGMMSVSIERGGSLDSAIREVARNGPKKSSKMFQTIVNDADTRLLPSIKVGLTKMLADLPEYMVSFRRSIYMIIAASESGDHEERKRMLKDASTVSLEGLKELGESYSSSLNTPCMIIFGLGIMVPMILMSVLPMLSLGGMFGSSPIQPTPIIVITLVLIPCAVAGVTLSLKEKNPFLSTTFNRDDLKYAYPVLVCIPVALICWNFTEDFNLMIIGSAISVGLALLVTLFSEITKQNIRSKQEQFLKDSVFELGNRLIAGENFETALTLSIKTRKECIPLSESLDRELKLCRGDVCSAIKTAIGSISHDIVDLYCDVYRCSKKDIRNAGRLAISIGRQLQDQNTVRKGIQNKLKNIVDMMSATTAIFAPLVLGMSVTMLGPISEISEGTSFENSTIVLSIYLVELCILMSVLTSYLNGRAGLKDILFKIGYLLPISMMVFLVCTRITL